MTGPQQQSWQVYSFSFFSSALLFGSMAIPITGSGKSMLSSTTKSPLSHRRITGGRKFQTDNCANISLPLSPEPLHACWHAVSEALIFSLFFRLTGLNILSPSLQHTRVNPYKCKVFNERVTHQLKNKTAKPFHPIPVFCSTG
jgi:hypothetical protein